MAVVGPTIQDFLYAVLDECRHSLQPPRATTQPRLRGRMNQPLDFVTDHQQLVQTDSTYVAPLMTISAAFAAIQSEILFTRKFQLRKSCFAIPVRQAVQFFLGGLIGFFTAAADNPAPPAAPTLLTGHFLRKVCRIADAFTPKILSTVMSIFFARQ